MSFSLPVRDVDVVPVGRVDGGSSIVITALDELSPNPAPFCALT